MIAELFSFPLSAILALVFCLSLYLTYRQYCKSQVLSGYGLSVVMMVIITVLTAIEGTWKPNLVHTPIFFVPVLMLMFLLGWCTLDSFLKKKSISFTATHLGLFLIFTGAFFGAPDYSTAIIKVSCGAESSYAVSDDGLMMPLDFKVSLKEFNIDWYEDGTSPKQYTSTLLVDGIEKTTSVNHPCRYKGWTFYQSDYDRKEGSYSIIRIVRDPWIPIVFLGMAILALGAILELKKTWHSKAVLPAVFILAAVFGVISLAKINFGTLMPALRSLWFVPHLIIYMVAYSVMALALICAVIGKPKSIELASKLLGTSSSLLIIGMLCGAYWAKAAWGDYWTWDAKECWAAVTWVLTLAGTHLPVKKKKTSLVLVILISFLAMQITWYGVNYLPSAEYSMHTYNQQ